MISTEKVVNNKVVLLINIYNFYFGYFIIRQTDRNIVHKIYISLIWFYINFLGGGGGGRGRGGACRDARPGAVVE